MLKKSIAVLALTLGAAGTVGGVSYAASASHPSHTAKHSAAAKHSAKTKSSSTCPHMGSRTSSNGTHNSTSNSNAGFF